MTQSICTDGQSVITGPIKFTPGSLSAPGITFNDSTSTGVWHQGGGILGVVGAGSGMLTWDPTKIGTGQDGSISRYYNGAILSPVGIVSNFAGSTAPSGWLLCYGQAVSRTGYPELFTVIGTTYGSGDGSTTFNLPDCRGRYVAGVDNMGGSAANRLTSTYLGMSANSPGATGGAQSATLVTGNLPAHSHGVTDPGHTHTYVSSSSVAGTFAAGGTNVVVISAGSTGSSVTGITIQNTGSGTAFGIVPPTIVMNTIIFAGRP